MLLYEKWGAVPPGYPGFDAPAECIVVPSSQVRGIGLSQSSAIFCQVELSWHNNQLLRDVWQASDLNGSVFQSSLALSSLTYKENKTFYDTFRTVDPYFPLA